MACRPSASCTINRASSTSHAFRCSTSGMSAGNESVLRTQPRPSATERRNPTRHVFSPRFSIDPMLLILSGKDIEGVGVFFLRYLCNGGNASYIKSVKKRTCNMRLICVTRPVFLCYGRVIWR